MNIFNFFILFSISIFYFFYKSSCNLFNCYNITDEEYYCRLLCKDKNLPSDVEKCIIDYL